VTPDGQPVQGYTVVDPATGRINTTGQPANIIIPHAVLRPPTATTIFGTVTNLDANAAIGDTFTSSIPIYDALGVTHVATVTMTKTAANTWGYAMTVPGSEVTPPVVGTSQIATGSLVFNGAGVLTTVNGVAAADVTITSPAWATGATATNFRWDLIDANGVASVTAFASPSATSSTTQNGSAAGSIDSILINSAGELVASFGAGHTVTVGQLALANFNNPQGLVKLGTNRFGESEASGIPSTGTAGTGGRGSLIGSALEQSNVDIATEFTQMILAQRGYQANSKSITVADELLLETLNLKR
jgi:flagellar hook protein FlgE